MKESQLVLKLKKGLNAQPKTKVGKINVNYFQSAGIPDLIGLVSSQFIAIETKVKNNRPTKIQLYQIEQIIKCGGGVGIVNENNYQDFQKEFILLTKGENQNV